MFRFVRRLVFLGLLVILAAAGYGFLAYQQARSDAPALAAQADALIADGRGGAGLGLGREDMLVAVQDPAFGVHPGFDLTTPGAGAATLTEALAPGDGVADFTDGLRRIRRMGYAVGLETRLTKPQIMAIYLDRAAMGPGLAGSAITGFHNASRVHFGAAPSQISRDDFLALVSVLIAPATLTLSPPNDALRDRLSRVQALIDGTCRPNGHDDIWLEGCADAG